MSQSAGTLVLVGNPNCGKTTLFNALTGTRQRVGNWPGVTVERKSGVARSPTGTLRVEDLPGIYSLEGNGDAAEDERIAQAYLADGGYDVIVNVIDSSALSRSLYLTTQLLQQGKPVIVLLNMVDTAATQGLHVDAAALAEALGCPVLETVASRGTGVQALLEAVASGRPEAPAPLTDSADPRDRYALVDRIAANVTQQEPIRRTPSERVDRIVLNRVLAFPIFLGVMYLMFLFSINFGSALIDFFDLVGTALFVELPRALFEAIGLPDWAIAILADGVGGGVALVATFIPVIGALFLALSVLEDSGYMGRVAFIVDRLLRGLGLPGKSFVPLIVGFGCNVPAVMATRTLEREPDRILTTIMAPYMSCGARLTVYALFAAAFFPDNGHNVVFALYLIGIAVAILTALIVRRYLISEPGGTFVMELPSYHLPTPKNVLLQTHQRLKGFVLRAGKAIVAVVLVLNVVNSVGSDGSWGNENTHDSLLSEIGRGITPLFAPMGIEADNWPATVGIFTGIFAKEVVVGTLDALYSADAPADERSIPELLRDAVLSVPANLADLGGALADPLGLDLDNLGDAAATAASQDLSRSTIGRMQALFNGSLGAFSYLLFVLLYMPCVATIGVIYKEIGAFWAIFSTLWSLVVAYSAAVLCYQTGQLGTDPQAALLWIGITLTLAAAMFAGLIGFGRRRQRRLIPVTQLD